MKRKTTLIFAIIFILIGVTGCASINLTDEEEDLIAEYSANSILQRSYAYNKLVDKDALQPETKADPESETTGATAVRVDTDNGTALNTLLGLDSFDVQYKGYEVTDSYPAQQEGGSDFVLKSTNGLNLFIAKFNVTNNTGQAVSLDMDSKDIDYYITLNNIKKYNAKFTVLLNALNTYNSTFEVGETRELVLVFQIDSEYENNISSITLETAGPDNEYSIILK